MKRNSKFIVIEGLDGSGKTTQTNILARRLEADGHDVVIQAEPTPGQFGRLCREALGGRLDVSKSQLALLFTLDRIDHNKNPENGIDALLDKGKTIICDRYYYSTLAYQGVDVGMDWLKNINLGCADIRKPDLVIFLDLEPQISLERITANRDASEIEIYENPDYLTKIRERFREVLSMLDGENISVISADDSIEAVADRIWECCAGNKSAAVQ